MTATLRAIEDWTGHRAPQPPCSPHGFPLTLAVAVLTAFLFWLTACSSAPRRAALHFSTPNAAPVRANIASAQTAIAAAQRHASAARANIAAAEKLAAPNVSPLLVSARGELDALSVQLARAGGELSQSQGRIGELEEKVSAQTDALNRAQDDKNEALQKLEAAQAANHRLRWSLARWRAALSLLVLAIGLFLFRRPLGALCGIPIP